MELASGMGFPPPWGAIEDYHFFFKNVNLWAIRESPLQKNKCLWHRGILRNAGHRAILGIGGRIGKFSPVSVIT
jgi:hypothetical protein